MENPIVPTFIWGQAYQKHNHLLDWLHVEVRESPDSRKKTDSFSIISNGCDTRFQFPPGSCLEDTDVVKEGLDVFQFNYKLQPIIHQDRWREDYSTGEYRLVAKIITPQHTLQHGVEKYTLAVINSLIQDTSLFITRQEIIW